MFKKFIEGLVFGGGFIISVSLIGYVVATKMFPISFRPQMTSADQESRFSGKKQPLFSLRKELEDGFDIPFHELSVDEQINKSTAIALAKFEPSPDGQMKAIIKEFLKKESGVEIYYNIGDEHPSSSYFPNDRTRHGDGMIIFFTGSPAVMRMSMTFSGNRIRSLGDIPIELFKKKCEKPKV